MIEVTSSVEIDRPANAVFAFVADAENNPEWQGGMRSCRWITEPPIRVGSIYRQEAVFLGRTIESTFEVVTFQPGSSITIATLESTFPIRVTRSVQPLGPDRCRVSAKVRGDPSGTMRLFAPILLWMVQRSVRSDYRRLRRHLGDSRGVHRTRDRRAE